MTTFVVIGGNAAGMSAASVAKRRDPALDVVVFEEGEHISYSACAIPYWISGAAPGPAERFVTVSPQEARTKRHLDVRLQTSVTAVDARAKRVTTRTPDGREDALHYDKLLFATGSEPKLPFAMEPLEGVFALRHLGDGTLVRRWLDVRGARRVAIVGGGYVALEMTEALVERGLEVTLVLRRRRVLRATLDDDMAEPLLLEAERRGVRIIVSPCEGIAGEEGRIRALRTAAGSVYADVVLLATGVKPRVELAARAGCALDVSGAILVDRGMRTNVPDVFAAGDCATVGHRLLGRPTFLPLALHANRGGRVAGENATGGAAESPGTIGTTITRFFELDIARTGLTRSEAAAAGYDAVAQTIDDGTQSGYMPTSQTLRIRMLVERGAGRILGAQIVGGPGAGKRIDTVATAIHAGLTARELEEADLAYAPPYSPSYDPILIAARMAARAARP